MMIRCDLNDGVLDGDYDDDDDDDDGDGDVHDDSS